MKNFLAGLVILGMESMGGFIALLLVKKDASNVTTLALICFCIAFVSMMLWFIITKILKHNANKTTMKE